MKKSYQHMYNVRNDNYNINDCENSVCTTILLNRKLMQLLKYKLKIHGIMDQNVNKFPTHTVCPYI